MKHTQPKRSGKPLKKVLTSVLALMLMLSLAVQAAAATSQISYSLSTSACQGNLSSYSLPAHQSTVSVGQKLYINVAATSDIQLKTIEAYVSENYEIYTLVGRSTAQNYMRWTYFEYTPSTAGTLIVFVRVYYTNGKTASGSTIVTVKENSSGGNTTSGNTKTYGGASYTVVPNANVTDYYYNQNNYSRFVNSSGKNTGCTATAMATAYAIRYNTPVDLKDSSKISWSSAGCRWELAKVLTDSGKTYSPYSYTETQALQAVYRSVNSGVPVIVGVKTSTGTDHVVTAIGYKQGANINNLSLSDILIVDPNGGQVRSLSYYKGIDNSWTLRVPILK